MCLRATDWLTGWLNILNIPHLPTTTTTEKGASFSLSLSLSLVSSFLWPPLTPIPPLKGLTFCVRKVRFIMYILHCVYQRGVEEHYVLGDCCWGQHEFCAHESSMHRRRQFDSLSLVHSYAAELLRMCISRRRAVVIAVSLLHCYLPWDY